MDGRQLAERLTERVSRLSEWALHNVDEAGQAVAYTDVKTEVSYLAPGWFHYRATVRAGADLVRAMQGAVFVSVLEAGGGAYVARIARRQVARNLANWESSIEGSTDDVDYLADLTGFNRAPDNLKRSWASLLAQFVRLAVRIAASFGGPSVTAGLSDLVQIALRSIEHAAASTCLPQPRARGRGHVPHAQLSRRRIHVLTAPHGPDLHGVPIAA